MNRAQQAQAEVNRKRVVETAARLFREDSVAKVSVVDVMTEAGLTHGGFYRQFASKDALVQEALNQALDEHQERLDAIRDPADAEGLARFLDNYLSEVHRESLGDGCPLAGFAGDIATPGADADLRAEFAKGIELYVEKLGDTTAVATIVGAMILARATAGTELSDRILREARASFNDEAPRVHG
ncbi:TetR/AcrR family transcriptional regulator [Actinoplanes sp. TBRC 11911]|uniref:TetR/AcrR family transcriptional regulator n=1 Tax=Actinoplanes sp. TBRC 11911 TaxID=2729386 RepID=UPI00145F815C|nr:TetR/AcrR family transcriptional regulator [Actinoplanes sp. TBRC 11911]NMO50910.1 TetR/AcrR family transcriptional regulator [Actinoplanes sp. TBRC 11911]